MDFFAVLKNRHMCRSFDGSKPLNDDQIKQLLDAGALAPSAGHSQDQRFLTVTDADIKEKLVPICRDQSFITAAPVIIAVYSDLDSIITKYGERGRDLFAIQDCAAAIQNILLAAEALGLGACWIGAFEEDPVKALLGLGGDVQLMALIPIGYKK